jgi:hypothetical protein
VPRADYALPRASDVRLAWSDDEGSVKAMRGSAKLRDSVGSELTSTVFAYLLLTADNKFHAMLPIGTHIMLPIGTHIRPPVSVACVD